MIYNKYLKKHIICILENRFQADLSLIPSKKITVYAEKNARTASIMSLSRLEILPTAYWQLMSVSLQRFFIIYII